MANVTEGLFRTCNAQEHIYIYGAGRNAADAWKFLQDHGIGIEGFVVTDMEKNPEVLFGHRVMTVEQFPAKERGVSLVLIPMPVPSRAYKEIYDCLIDNQIHNAWFFPMDLMRYMQEELKRQKLEEILHAGPYHMGEGIPVEDLYTVLCMDGEGGQEYHWRYQTHMAEKQKLTSIGSVFREMTAIEEFERAYGKYHIFPAGKKAPGTAARQADYAVYMARSHVDRTIGEIPSPDWIVPIQVGAALTDQDICRLKDNAGDNISEQNGNYSECTALYWMWKHAPRTDYIGLCHYRRHFDMEEADIGGLAAEDIDVLVTAPTFVNETVETFFSVLIPKTDLGLMLETIGRVCPAYKDTAQRFLTGRFYPPCNLFIMKYDLFQEYGDFVFSVTSEIEAFYRSMGFYRKDRYMGFIIECLMGIFLMQHKERLKIAYADMRFYT